jgi:hypothetical protein
MKAKMKVLYQERHLGGLIYGSPGDFYIGVHRWSSDVFGVMILSSELVTGIDERRQAEVRTSSEVLDVWTKGAAIREGVAMYHKIAQQSRQLIADLEMQEGESK